MAKVTFSLDDETVRKLKQLSDRTKKPQSLIVREAVARYAGRDAMLTPEEQARILRVLDRMRQRPPDRSNEETDAEIREIREARRTGGRLHPVD